METKISIAEALKLVTVSKTTLYRDLKENKLSSTTDAKGKKLIDTAELERFYGQLKSPSVNGTGNNGNSQSDPTEQNGTHGNQESDTSEHNGTRYGHPAVIAVLEDQVAVLKSQLESERGRKGETPRYARHRTGKDKTVDATTGGRSTPEEKAELVGGFSAETVGHRKRRGKF